MIGPRALLPHPSSVLAAAASRSALLLLLVLVLAPSCCQAQTTFPTAAPTLACPSEAAAWVQCIQGGGLDPQACADCYFSYGDSLNNQTTCGELTGLICAQIETCAGSCGTGCGSLVEAFETCIWGPVCGAVSCSTPSTPTATTPTATTPTSTPPPAPAPASSPVLAPTPDECGTEATALASCISSTGDLTACLECVQAYGESTPPVTCDDVQPFTCGIEAACPDCGTCQAEQVALVICQDALGCGAFECSAAVPTTTTSPPPASSPVSSPPVSEPPSSGGAGGGGDDQCTTAQDDLEGCLSNNVTAADATSCGACVSTALAGLGSDSGSGDCGAVTTALCTDLEGCAAAGCGPCSDGVRTLAACAVADQVAGCALECGGGGAGTAPTPAVTPTAPTASGGEAPTPTAAGGGGGDSPPPSSGAQCSSRPLLLLLLLTTIWAGAVASTMADSLA